MVSVPQRKVRERLVYSYSRCLRLSVREKSDASRLSNVSKLTRGLNCLIYVSVCAIPEASAASDSRRWWRTTKSPVDGAILDGYRSTTPATAGFSCSSSDSHIGHELDGGSTSGIVVVGAVETNGQGARLIGRVVSTPTECQRLRRDV